ncbi:DUF1822 family protein [Phormidium sp. CLA17]|uniref:DUF1822 family protein n=1 Tax=Leptolyngbya sp. Cla-17 TaxID=2803751 RepID=UPI0018D8F523|nr:DUF1822 family protein [Leptolyngbya sp. Cla-17]MBM0740910.1 DUF1822 family protein [Leptolyngbya sp. Cla-17]
MMSFDSAPSTYSNRQVLHLEIPPVPTTAAAFSTPGCRWRADLNQMVIAAFLPWLRDEFAANAKVWMETTLPSIWEFANGTAIALHPESAIREVRLVLIPAETLDTDELRVPQEWVDLPSWAADYYVAVQVNPDESWIEIWGYASHERLKTRGVYDASDRTYSLAEEDLVHDLTVLQVAQELCPTETRRAAIVPIPTIELTQATNLIERLDNPDLSFPRLAIPFLLWGALLEHGGWRKRLYEHRQGLAESWSVAHWLQAGVSNLAAQVGWQQTTLQFATVRGMRSLPITGLVRSLTIAGAAYQLQIAPLGDRSTPETAVWQFELRSADPRGTIPAGITLRLLTEDLQPFENNEDMAQDAVERLYINVAIQTAEGLVWEIEPTPEGYDREVLRF